MKPHELRSLLATLPTLKITAETTEQETAAAQWHVGSFNQCDLGLLRFEGQTPWVWHREEKLLHVLEGSVDLTLRIEPELAQISLLAGQLFVVPAAVWHQQTPNPRVTLLSLTPKKGNRRSVFFDRPIEAIEVSRLIEAEIDADPDLSDLDRAELKAELHVPPVKREYVDLFSGQRLDVWLVHENQPGCDDGYQVVFEERQNVYGLAVNGKILGFSGNRYLRTLADM